MFKSMKFNEINSVVKMQDRAKILLEALPYIQQFHGKTIVIKLGGSVLGKEEMLDSILQDVVLLNLFGMKIVMVHRGTSCHRRKNTGNLARAARWKDQ